MELQTGDVALLGGLVAAIVALIRLAERMLDAVLEKRNGRKKSLAPAPAGGCRGLTQEEHAALMRLDEMHDKHDQDGTPLWYVPRSWAQMLIKITETQNKISSRMIDMVKAQERLNNRIERWENNTSNVSTGRR
jgi:hypothetical protein